METIGWAKIYRTLPGDEKIRSMSTSKRWVFVCYILMAQRNGRWKGYLVNEAGNPYTQTERAAYCGIDRSGIARHDSGLVAMGLLEVHVNERLKVKNYDRYQCAKMHQTAEPECAKPGADLHTDCADLHEECAKTRKECAKPGADLHNLRSKTGLLRIEEVEEIEEVKNTTPLPPNGGECEGFTCADEGAERTAKQSPSVEYSADFERFWGAYPRHCDKRRAWRVWQTRLREGVRSTAIIAAAENYATFCRGKEERFIKLPATFIGPDKSYEEWDKAKLEGVKTNGRTTRNNRPTSSADEAYRKQWEGFDL